MTGSTAVSRGVCLLFALALLSLPAAAFVPYEAASKVGGTVIEPQLILQSTSDGGFQEQMSRSFAPFARFQERYGGTWFLRMDRRTLRPALVWGSGLPWLSEGDYPSGDVDAVAAYLEATARRFMEVHSDLFGLDVEGLALERVQTVGVASYRVWSLEFRVRVGGVPVRGAKVFFRVNSGNLIQFGVRHVDEALESVPTAPAKTRSEAWSALLRHAGGPPDVHAELDPGTLLLLPVADDARAYDGPPGEGLAYRLVWRFSFRRAGEIPTWVAWVDAASGEVVAFWDDNKYDCVLPPEPQGRVYGGIYPRHPEQDEVVRAMPYTAVIHGGPLTTDYNGIFPLTPDVLSETGLNGTYFDMQCDNCENPSQAWVSDPFVGDLYLGTGGDNTTGNGLSTAAERNTFYHLNVARALASKHLDNAATNNYLDRTMPAVVNIASTCNAFWNGMGVNMFMAGGGCNNTGEIADVVQHEWGHGLDQFTTAGGIQDGARSEGLSDTVAVLGTHSPIMSPYFRVGNGGGIRNVDEWNSTRGLLTVSNLLDKCPDGNGPNGGEVHCEGEIFGQTNWRLGVRLREKYGDVGGWYALERLFFASLPLSETYVPDQSGSAYDAYVAVDDDNGNLADGTPNADAINDAFVAHEIASDPQVADSAECTPPTAPTPGLSVLSDPDTGLYQVRVSWDDIPGSVQYDVLRNQDGPGAMSVLVGTLLEPFSANPVELIDDKVFDGQTYYYRIRAFDDAGCVSINDTTRSVTVAAMARLGLESFETDDMAGNYNGIVEPGETITLPVTIRNRGGDAHNTVARIETSSPGVTLITDQASYGDVAGGTTAAPSASHFVFQLDNDPSLCGGNIAFRLTIEADEGCAYESFVIPVGVLTGADVLLADDLESDTGWVVNPDGDDDASTGIWVREDPNPTGFQPDDDHTAAGTDCWVTGNLDNPNAGADDVDDGCTTLQSPAGWDLGGQTGVELAYWRHYVLERRFDDELLVEISNDGAQSWQTLETVGQTATPFTEARFALDDVLGGAAGQVALRFTACDTGEGSLVEALVDDVSIEVPIWTCEDPTPRARLFYASFRVDDGISLGSGNADGIVDPGEQVVLPVTLLNQGNDTARLISGTLRLGAGAPAGVLVTDDYAGFPDIPAGEGRESAGPDPLHFELSLAPNDMLCGATIPLELDYSYEGQVQPLTGTASFSLTVGVTQRLDIFFDDFETPGDNGWTHAQVATEDDWEHGGLGGGSATDPVAAYSGDQIWGNDLGNGTNGNYPANVHNYLDSPVVDMSSSVNSKLLFQRWLAVEDGVYDQAVLSVNGSVIWENPVGSGSDHLIDTAWVEREYDISALADGNPAVQVRFEIMSDAGLHFGGWNIDDFRLVSDEPVCNTAPCSAPPADPLGNLLRLAKNGANAELDWTAYAGNGSMFNVYRGSSLAVLPMGAPQLLSSARTGKSLADPLDPGATIRVYEVRALNECFEEE